MKFTTTIDVPFNTTDSQPLFAQLDKFELSSWLIEREGPAGGNPVYGIQGPFAQLMKFLEVNDYDVQMEEVQAKFDAKK